MSEASRKFAWNMAVQASPKATIDCVKVLSLTDFRQDLRVLAKVPTLVIHGDTDQVIPFAVSGKRTHELIPGSKLLVKKDGAHSLTCTQPEWLNEALLEFIEG